ncbi:DUF3147 family protein [Metallibacterium sp.]|uniref:DUF3147 family protein n=1 Tax=Metallibacterium sp. TaxID=2940281 RepID=UPI0026099E11|nr:DUF3147 family protein [Metallibacterium sp.]
MLQYALKVLLTAVVIVAISAIARRSSFWAALLASLPLTSLLAFIWLYVETGDRARVAALSSGVFWLVLPSLPLFLLLPALLRAGWNFWLALLAAAALAVASYGLMLWLLGKLGVQL